MKKALYLLISIFISSAYADTIPQSCPSTLTCDYQKGKCDNNDWQLGYNNATEEFTGSQTIQLDSLNPYVNGSNSAIYCNYKYGRYSSFMLLKKVDSFVGSWVNFGFGGFNLKCSSSDFSSCQFVPLLVQKSK